MPLTVRVPPHIASLQAVMQQELREAFGSTGSPQPTRYLRSQQHRVRETVDAADGACDDDDAETAGGDSTEMDPYELLDPVEILSKLPKDFYEKLEAKKWQERKEALDALENLLKNAPKLEPGDYADLVRALKKVISKDANVMLVALSTRLLGLVASGLRNKFHPYASACIQAILDKFKEKKSNVVTALREAADAIYPSVSTVQCWWRSGTSSTRTRPPAYKPYSTSSRRRRATLSPRSGRLPTLSILV
ncbi:hypothetical protein O0L34_g10431 [Tuta absoluta]|nr:hypothetical protein O0L34_g10431 [Tuta absoluta]